ncbi:importin 13 [Aspergillus niger CBS 101883]|uniref:importin 13 n=1 Tax=Aspergillus lacticoffeatus (strain CBS 101883) TaxID=1450533 RepID=UPI000D7EBC66|nr:importin 13 [Aspergillus niger CBS 101883]PYH58407.1 importin 13 [Aspergillus niger CBS 101883]
MSVDIPGQALDAQFLINEAKSLVSQLYDPGNTGNPAKIKAIQEHLQSLQKSPQAWLIANQLLSESSTDLRFFGALTFTVKINHDWQSLSPEEAQELLGRLIDHYVFLVNGGERPLVIRKLASSLATIFLKPNAPWSRALCNLAASLADGKHVSEEYCKSIDLRNAVLPAMSERHIHRWSSEPRRSREEHHTYVNVKDAFSVVDYVLSHIMRQHASGIPASDEALGTEAINSYQAWMNVRSAIQLRDSLSVLDLASTTAYIIQSMKVPGLAKSATQVVVELIDWRDSIFTQDHLTAIMEYVVSDFGTAHVASLMEADFEDENMTFLDLLLAYATLKQRDLMTKQLDPQHAKMLTLLHTLFRAPGYAAVDDPASPLVLEWWTEVADDLQDLYSDLEDQTSLEPAKRNLAEAALDCFEKLKFPSPEVLQGWGDDDRSEFGSFRRDVCDFLLAIYPMLGVELVRVFQERARVSLVQQEWRTFEAAIFCIAQLSEAVDENQHADECLNSIFFCDDFARLCEGNGVLIPDKPRQTLVDMLGKYQSYFERTHALLPRVLTFLFASLDVSSCAPTASKSIAYLCKSCRNALTSELPAFIDQFEHFRFKPTATTHTMEKVLEGIAAIIQTLPTDEAKSQVIERILQFFHGQAEAARDEAVSGLVEQAQTRGQFVLRCVASIGKGLRTDGEVNLESNDHGDGDPYPPTFWNTGSGAVSQSLIMQCMQLLITDFPVDVTMIEAACDILKAGYIENTGPYVFPPMVTVNFVKSIPLGSVGTDIVMGTASSFLASHSSHCQRIRDETVALIVHVYDTFCWMHEKPEYYDPEVANSGIDFLTRLLPKYHPFLFALTTPPQEASQAPSSNGGDLARPSVLEAVLNFTLLSLRGPEPLPLRSASQFWVNVLTLPSDGSSSSGTDDDILSWIPSGLTPETTSNLTAELAKPISEADEPGYIYMFWMTPSTSESREPPSSEVASNLMPPTSSPGRDRRVSDAIRTARDLNALASAPTHDSPGTLRLKIGRANNVQRRLNEWSRQCSHHLTLIRYYPYTPSTPQPSPSRRGGGGDDSTATLVPGRKVPHVHRVERLIHLELADVRIRDLGKCADCGREHREWFEITAEKTSLKRVDDCIRRWVKWAETH